MKATRTKERLVSKGAVDRYTREALVTLARATGHVGDTRDQMMVLAAGEKEGHPFTQALDKAHDAYALLEGMEDTLYEALEQGKIRLD